ncbi:hypothetical protein ACFE04_001899 [Oxalis oulophora]
MSCRSSSTHLISNVMGVDFGLVKLHFKSVYRKFVAFLRERAIWVSELLLCDHEPLWYLEFWRLKRVSCTIKSVLVLNPSGSSTLYFFEMVYKVSMFAYKFSARNNNSLILPFNGNGNGCVSSSLNEGPAYHP